MANYRQSGAQSPHASTKTALTSERIAADIAAFNKAGGRIEVLGNTPFHHRAKSTEAAVKSSATAAEQPAGSK